MVDNKQTTNTDTNIEVGAPSSGEEFSPNQEEITSKKPYHWVPTLYLTEGLPYVIITALAVVFYKKLGFNNTDATYFTSWLYLPWVIKPFWSPFIDMFKTKRWWTLAMQLLMGAGFASIGLLLMEGVNHFLSISMIIFWLIAFSSATHDAAADGFYILSLSTHDQSFYVGIRNTFYRVSIIIGQGALLFIAGLLEEKFANIPLAWSSTFLIAGALICLMRIYHGFALPKPASDIAATHHDSNIAKIFFRTFYKFITKKGFGLALAFILLFRLGEAQLGRMSSLFMLDSLEAGGLGLSTKDIGIIYGTFGVIALTLGGILGGYVVSRDGLKKWFFPMVLSMNVPNLAYVFMANVQPENYVLITSLVCIEQFGYGFGYTAFTLYLIYFSRGQYKTTYYAICTGLMALGMMLPGFVAGMIQEHIGYSNFFIWVCICTIPGFIIAYLLPLDEKFGKKE